MSPVSPEKCLPGDEKVKKVLDQAKRQLLPNLVLEVDEHVRGSRLFPWQKTPDYISLTSYPPVLPFVDVCGARRQLQRIVRCGICPVYLLCLLNALLTRERDVRLVVYEC